MEKLNFRNFLNLTMYIIVFTKKQTKYINAIFRKCIFWNTQHFLVS